MPVSWISPPKLAANESIVLVLSIVLMDINSDFVFLFFCS